MFKRKERFGLRKYKQGLVSVGLGTVLLVAAITTVPDVFIPSTIVYAAEASYAANDVWTLNDQIPASNAYINPDPNLNFTPFKAASTSITTEDGKTVDLTATITPTSGVQEGISYLVEGNDQSSYDATSDMLLGNPNPSSIPALGIYVQAHKFEGVRNTAEHAASLNYNGEEENAIVTLKFSEPVVNPILDISGLGGSAWSDYRGSFNATRLELLTDGVSLGSATGVNLQSVNNSISVINHNTDTHAVLTEAQYDAGESWASPLLEPAGTGSFQLLGTVSEVSFKLYHQAIPYSAFNQDEYLTGSDYFLNRNNIVADGTNGFNTHWSDSFGNEGGTITEYVGNADLFRLSVRLENVKKGSVVVNYTDTTGLLELKPTYKDTDNQPAGTDYNTNDNTEEKPTEIKTEDGKLYRLAPEGSYPVGTVTSDSNLSQANNEKFGIDTVTGTVEADIEKSVTYVYEEVKGSVHVNYFQLDESGQKTELKLSGTAEGENLSKTTVASTEAVVENASGETDYDTTSLRPLKITDADGVEWELVPSESSGDDEQGKVEAGTTKEVNYYYKKVTPVVLQGNVEVHYHVVNVDGDVLIADAIPAVVKDLADEGTNYSTVSDKKSEITVSNKTYVLVTDENSEHPVTDGDPEEGQIVGDTTKKVNYYYVEKPAEVGSVVVYYLDTEGNELQPSYQDATDQPVGDAYDATEGNERPLEITKDGKVYTLVPEGNYPIGEVSSDGNLFAPSEDKWKLAVDPAVGNIIPGLRTVAYVYQLKEEPEAKTGSVVVRHITEDGTVLEGPTDVVRDGEVGSSYSTSDKSFDGYTLVKVDETGAPANGTVTEGEQTVTYIYKKVEEPTPDPEPEAKTGSVVVRHITEDGTVLEGPTDVVRDGEVGSSYSTSDKSFDGYTLVKVDETGAPANGTVTEGEQTVTYVYKKVEEPTPDPEPEVKKGSVVVRHITEDGTVLEGPTDVVRDGEVGSSYSTSDKSFDGYTLVKVDETGAPANGTVTEGEQTVTYIYKKVEEPTPDPEPEAKTGSVVVRHITEDGTVLEGPTDVVRDGEVGSSYSTSDKSFDGYTLVKVDETGAPANGTVTEGEQTVTYIYKKVEEPTPDPEPEAKTGSVVVRHITEDGTVLEGPTDVVRDGEVGSSYSTSDKTFDGYTLVKVDETGAPANGTVTEGEQTVTYIYKKVEEPTPEPEAKTGSVVVHHITEDGTVLEGPTDVVRDGEVGTAYNTTDKSFDGYTLVKVDETGAPANGTVTEGEQTVTYIYKKVEEPTPEPEVKTGSVVVRHITEDGTVLEGPTDVVRDGEVGSSYSTSDKSFDGYTLVKVDETGAPANGTVTEGEQTVTYIYKKVEEPTPDPEPEAKTGSVVVRHITEDGTVLEGPTDVVRDGEVGSSYSTSDKTFDSYTLVKVDETGAPANGTVTEGQQTVTYIYKKIETPAVTTDQKSKTTVMSQVDANEKDENEPYKATISSTQKVKSTKVLLPSTGESNNSAYVAFGLAIVMGAVTLFKRKKKN